MHMGIIYQLNILCKSVSLKLNMNEYVCMENAIETSYCFDFRTEN